MVPELNNAPRFPQGKAVSKYSIGGYTRTISQESIAKMTWANEQVHKVLQLEPNTRLAISVTNFDANPTTMKRWLVRACADMFQTGNRHLYFQFRGSRRNGVLYVQMVYGYKPRKGKEMTQRV
jgi:hypothetical protein